MGVAPKLSIAEVTHPRAVAALGQPNPRRCRITRYEIVNGYLILMVEYPDCTNFEGRKILVFDRGVSLSQIGDQDGIDPHFSDSQDKFYPIARLRPTERGWDLARKMAKE